MVFGQWWRLVIFHKHLLIKPGACPLTMAHMHIVKLPLRRSWIFFTIIGPIFDCHSLTMALWIDLTCPSLASSSWSVPPVVLTALLPTCVNCSTSSIMATANVSLCFHFHKFAFVLFILFLTDDVTACSKHYVYVCGMYVPRSRVHCCSTSDRYSCVFTESDLARADSTKRNHRQLLRIHQRQLVSTLRKYIYNSNYQFIITCEIDINHHKVKTAKNNMGLNHNSSACLWWLCVGER